VGSKRRHDAVRVVAPASAPPSDILAKRPRHQHIEDVPSASLYCDFDARAGDDVVENAEAIRFLRTHSITWQQESEGESAAEWRLCVHPFLGSDLLLPKCFRLLRALAALHSEKPRPLSVFHCATRPFFESMASFSLADCATALEITEYAQLPKILHDCIVDHAVVGALGQVLCTADPPEGPSWHKQCCSLRSEVGSLVRSVAALVPDRLVTIALARSGVQLSRQSKEPAHSDAELLVHRVLSQRFDAPLAAVKVFCGSMMPWEQRQSPDLLAGLWGRPSPLLASIDAPVAVHERARIVDAKRYHAYVLGRILSARSIPAGRDLEVLDGAAPPAYLSAAAAALGQVDALQKLRFRGAAFTADVFVAAATAGNTHCLRLLWDANCAVTTQACAAAAGTGRLEVLQWLHARSPPCPWDEEVCANAARAGHLPVLQWAAAAGCPCGEKTLTAAISARRTDAIRWLCVERGLASRDQRARVLKTALQRCDVAMLKLARELDVPLEAGSLDVVLKLPNKHRLRCVHAATAAGYDFVKAGLAAKAAAEGDRQLLRFAHSWGAQPDPGVLAAAARIDDVPFLQEVAALGHPKTTHAAESSAAAGAFRALEWLLATGCPKWSCVYVKLAEGSGMDLPDFMDPPSEAQRRSGRSHDSYDHVRFRARQLHLMQSLHAEGVPLPPDGLLWRALVPGPDFAAPKDCHHPALLWLWSIGYEFPVNLVACARDVAAALEEHQYSLLRLLRQIRYPAAEGPHLWRAASSGLAVYNAPAAIRFLLLEKYPLPQPPGTLFTAIEFDAFATATKWVPLADACELIGMLAAAGYPPSHSAMRYAARRGELPLAKALRQAQCLLTPAHVETAWNGDHTAVARWMRWQLLSQGPQAAEYSAEADKRYFSSSSSSTSHSTTSTTSTSSSYLSSEQEEESEIEAAGSDGTG